MNRSRYLILTICFSMLGIAQGYRIIGPWQPIFRGAEICYCTSDTPRLQKLTAVRIDLQDPAVAFEGTHQSGSYDTTRETGTAFMNSLPVQFGINTHYYLTYGDYADLEGVYKNLGVTISPQTDDWPIRKGTLLITQDNIASMAMTYVSTDLSAYWTAVESRDGYIMKNGVVNVWGDVTIHPRSGVTISQDGRYIVFLTVDGRQTGYSDGCMLSELADWMKDLGGYNGMNLDGGGSTHMLIEDSAGNPVTVNSPSENRAVGSHMGCYLAPAPALPSYQTDAPITNGLIIHLKADCIGAADGEGVEVWQDIATNDTVDGTVYSVGKFGFPIFRATGYNGDPAVEFSGSQALASSYFNWNETQGVCAFIVCTGGNGSVQRVMQIGYGGISSQNVACDVSNTSSGLRYNNGYATVSGAISAGTWHTSIRQVAQGSTHDQGFYAVDDTTAETLTCNNPANVITFVPADNFMTVGIGSSTASKIGTDPYIGKISQILVYNRQLTTQEMQTILDYFDGIVPDTTPPAPDPMTWASVPAATDSTTITMTATTASDPSGVEYYFDETSGNPGGTDSGWQASATYTDTGLTEGTTYSYTVKARDLSANFNETALSTVGNATTPDMTAPTPNPMTWASVPAATSSSAITMTATTASDLSGVEYYFDETSGNPGGTDSGWQASPVYTDTGLSGSTTYSYTVKARDLSANLNETAISTVGNATTSAAVPTFVAAGAVSSGTATITPALPAGIAAGDILLLFIETSNQAVSISNQNGGTWTAVTNSPQYCGTAASTTGARLTAFWSRYNGTQGAPTVSDSGNHQLGRMIAIRNAASAGNPWDVTAGGVEALDDTTGSIAGATTTVANTLVVTAIATSLPDASSTAKFSGWANANLTSLTERTDNSVTAGNGGGLAIATGLKATAGAYGNTAVTLVNAAYKGMISIAIKP